MSAKTLHTLRTLYNDDETAWLEVMAEMIRRHRFKDLDYSSLQEYLSDMARRDRREIESRLVLLIAHMLKWERQRSKRCKSWRATIVEQRQQLARTVGRGVLRNHAEKSLAKCYSEAVEIASAQTGIDASKFDESSPYTLDGLLSPDALRS